MLRQKGGPNSVVVTGMGVVSPVGNSLTEFHRSLACGRNGVGPTSIPWQTGYGSFVAGCVDLHPDRDRSEPDGLGRATRFALNASRQALEQSGVDLRMRPQLGVVVGSTFVEVLQLEDEWVNRTEHDGRPSDGGLNALWTSRKMSAVIGDLLGLTGPRHLLTTTCAAGNHAIAWACDLIRSGSVQAVLAVATDSIGCVDAVGFCSLLLQADDCCRPFDLNRKGTVLSEGAGALVLESFPHALDRNVRILAEVAGYGLSCDAAGPFGSRRHDTSSWMIAALQSLEQARCVPDDIQYVSAHGSGTRLNDSKETLFLKQLLGDRAYEVPVSSIKSMLGHTQGAASLLEAIACVLSFEHDLIYPTINYLTPDPDCDLDYVCNQARRQRVDTVLSNAFGIGGNNCMIVLRRWDR